MFFLKYLSILILIIAVYDTVDGFTDTSRPPSIFRLRLPTRPIVPKSGLPLPIHQTSLPLHKRREGPPVFPGDKVKLLSNAPNHRHDHQSQGISSALSTGMVLVPLGTLLFILGNHTADVPSATPVQTLSPLPTLRKRFESHLAARQLKMVQGTSGTGGYIHISSLEEPRQLATAKYHIYSEGLGSPAYGIITQLKSLEKGQEYGKLALLGALLQICDKANVVQLYAADNGSGKLYGFYSSVGFTHRFTFGIYAVGKMEIRHLHNALDNELSKAKYDT